MATATFGKPETGGVLFGVNEKQLETATLLYRAIHTLEHIRDHEGLDEGSISGGFAAQSWRDLRYLLKQVGVSEKDIDIGEFYHWRAGRVGLANRTLKTKPAGQKITVRPA